MFGSTLVFERERERDDHNFLWQSAFLPNIPKIVASSYPESCWSITGFLAEVDIPLIVMEK